MSADDPVEGYAASAEGLDAGIARSLRHPARIAVLRALTHRTEGLSLDDLADMTRAPRAALARHLGVLRQVGAVHTSDSTPDQSAAPERPAGREHYTLADTPLARALAGMLAPPPTPTPVSRLYDTLGDLDILLNQIPSGVAIYDEHGHLLRQNAAGYRIARRQPIADEPADDRQHRYGMRYADGRPISEADSPSGRARRGEMFNNAEYLIDGQHGTETRILASGAPLLDESHQPRGAVLVFTDVTEQRTLEREERRQRALAEAVIDWAPVGIALFDVTGDFRCLRHNALFLQLAGSKLRDSDSLQGLTLPEFFDVETGLRVRAVFEQVRDSGVPVTIHEFSAVLPPQPEPRWYRWSLTPLRDDGGNIVALLCGAIEITELVRVREQLRQQAARLETLIAAMPEAVAVADRDGSFLYTNATAEALWGKPAPEGIQSGDYAAEFPCYDTNGALLASEQLPLPRALTGETVIGQELTYLRPDGEKVDLLCNAAPIYDENTGVIAGGVVVFQNISHMKELERQRDEFLSIAAHELRTPLTTILGTLQVIGRQLARSDERPLDHTVLVRNVDRISRQAERINKLVADLLDTTRIAAGRLEVSRVPCDLAAVARDAADGQAMVHTTSRIVTELPARPVQVQGDPTRLSQVIENLLTNALKYSDEDQPVELSLTVEDRRAHLRVSDSGIGIPADGIEHLFERFYRVPGIQVQSGSGVGLGLGLYITRQIVEQHGGEIVVESQPGEGTTVHVLLPLAT